MNSPNNPTEYRETKIVLEPGSDPVDALVRIEWIPPDPPGPALVSVG